VPFTHRRLTRATKPANTLAFFTAKWSRRAMLALVIWISCGLVAVRSAVSDVPTGTIEFTGKSVAVGVGYSWGKGILIFEGRHYPLKVDGLSVVHVGVSRYTATGTVYNLMKVSDINGVYTAVSAGAAIGGGASATAMKNSKGVLIQMVSTHIGLNFSLGPKGVTITQSGRSY
jgi:hypothetical protein